MSNYSFVTKEDVNNLEIFKARGKRAVLTDFSILLGAVCFEYNGENIGWYWTKTDDNDNGVFKVDDIGKINNYAVDQRDGGARISQDLKSIDYGIPRNGEFPKRAKDDILEVEFGYYPQTAASVDMQKVLEREYMAGNISKTENSYTTDSVDSRNDKIPFQPKTHNEYEYNGKRYVRVEANPWLRNRPFSLSNKEEYSKGEAVWVEVEPVKWLIDENAKKMVTEKIIFSGIQFNKENNYCEKGYDDTDMKKFIDTYFSKDLVQERVIEQKSQATTNSHSRKEAKETITSGISAFTKIFELYQNYFTRSEDKEKDDNDSKEK